MQALGLVNQSLHLSLRRASLPVQRAVVRPPGRGCPAPQGARSVRAVTRLGHSRARVR